MENIDYDNDDNELGLLYGDNDDDNIIDNITELDGEEDDVKNIRKSFNIPNEIMIKFDSYVRIVSDKSPQELKLALVKKHHSLWAEFVYNASRVLADYIDTKKIDCENKNVLELGAGAGLPGMIAGLNNASTVIITDYGTETEKDLLFAININIASIKNYIPSTSKVEGQTYIWGYKCDSFFNVTNGNKFDVIIMADLIFNRSEHRKLLTTVKLTLCPNTGVCWCAFSHHDPGKRDKDLAFFTIAEEEFGFVVEKINEEKRKSYPFVEHDGLDDQRGVIYIYTLTLPQ